MKLLLILALLLTYLPSSAQQSDFFLLKRSGKTVKSFFTGGYINFATKKGETCSGYIKKVAHDSVWVEYQDIIKGYTAFGGVLLDTIAYEARRFAITDIASIHKEEKRLEQSAPAVLLRIGSTGYILLHIINSIILHQTISLKKLGIAAGVYIASVLIHKLHKEDYYIGGKYSLQYVSLSAK
jgi:hypothetical protein